MSRLCVCAGVCAAMAAAKKVSSLVCRRLGAAEGSEEEERDGDGGREAGGGGEGGGLGRGKDERDRHRERERNRHRQRDREKERDIMMMMKAREAVGWIRCVEVVYEMERGWVRTRYVGRWEERASELFIDTPSVTTTLYV